LWPVQFAIIPLSLVIKPISVPPEMHPRERMRGDALLQVSRRSNFLFIERTVSAVILSDTDANI